jgi:hypothetical protein
MSEASRARQRGLFGRKLSAKYPHILRKEITVTDPLSGSLTQKFIKVLVSGFNAIDIQECKVGKPIQFRGSERRYVVRNNVHITHLKTRGGMEAIRDGDRPAPGADPLARTGTLMWYFAPGKRPKSRACCNCGDEAIADMKTKVWVHKDKTAAGIYCERTERVR